MTVKELIEKLLKVKDQDKKVSIGNLGTGWTGDIDEVESLDGFDDVILFSRH